ncbi:MAG: T9SS type A sorting domain-containing protein, partial [Paludibacter sp.]
PVRNELYFSRDLSASTSIEIFNLYGCLVKREIVSGKTMNVSGLASGCYLLRMNGKKQLKFIKE